MTNSLNSAVSPFQEGSAVREGKVEKIGKGIIQPTLLPQVAFLENEPKAVCLGERDGEMVYAYPRIIFMPSVSFYSQSGEDLEIYIDFFKHEPVDNGIYVEIGAGNGIEFSNTLFFHQTLGFRGLLVEANPHHRESLRMVRPGDVVAMFAAGESEGTAPFLFNGEKWAQSHRLDTVTQEVSETLQGKNFEKNEVFEVPVKTLANMLDKAEIEYIDFMSIDVEGSELEVLKGMNWDIPVRIILLECFDAECSVTQDRNEEVRQILRDNGFVFHKKVASNDIWYDPKYARYPEGTKAPDAEQIVTVPT